MVRICVTLVIRRIRVNVSDGANVVDAYDSDQRLQLAELLHFHGLLACFWGLLQFFQRVDLSSRDAAYAAKNFHPFYDGPRPLYT